MLTPLDQAELAAALRAALGLQARDPAKELPAQVVRRLLPDPHVRERVQAAVARRLAAMLLMAARDRLGLPTGAVDLTPHRSLWEAFVTWAGGANGAWEREVYGAVMDAVGDGLAPKPAAAAAPATAPAPVAASPPARGRGPVRVSPSGQPQNLADKLYKGPAAQAAPPRPDPPPPQDLAKKLYKGPAAQAGPEPPKPTGLHPDAGKSPPNALSPNPAGLPEKAKEYMTPPPDPAPAADPPPADPAPPPAVTGPVWRYIPPPDDIPDPHAESDACEAADPPAGFRLFGARVRGKKHKHDGTHCDDWFEFDRAGDWTVVAVADGAGSKKFSRVGAKAACEAAVRVLAEELPAVEMEADRLADGWTAGLDRPEPALAFADPGIDAVRQLLHAAVNRAYEAVVAAAARRAADPDHAKVLGRPLDIGDLSCTLLLAAHRPVRIDGKDADFVLACQVGDGLVGVVDGNGDAHPLGSADSGGFSGETEFLTSDGKRDAAYLDRKVAAFIGPVGALLVMTDGVADDYFPAPAELGRLWADLLANGIPDGAAPGQAADDGDEVEVVGPDPRQKVKLRSAAAVAGRLGTTVGELLKDPAALRGLGVPGDTPADRLRLWLDAYVVRGSFDDRTLVVLHREGAP
ncbi:MAG: hypothetical protein C0501_14525 [Isosphaera sp.]|nr:hypothetical protein [Isosphaera sp.]